MSKQLNLHIIEHARALIANEAHWCRRQMAFDGDGGAVMATDRRASRLCAYGALIASAHHMTNDCDRSYRLVSRAVMQFGGSSALIDMNDIEGHAAVLALFDAVIAQQSLER
jgi:hypothetical protein